MASKRTIKRIVLTALWVAITGGVITLLVAANGPEQKHYCEAVHITVQGTGERYFISKDDIEKLLQPSGEAALKGQLTDRIDLAGLETKLEQNAWIQDAELYFDRDDELHVLVTERQPIARVFARNGVSFYIDGSGTRLPLLPHISARVPVITGYPSAKKPAGPRDSAVIQDVRHLVQYISAHEFWSAQVAQIDIMPDWSLELLPTVGNHVIRLGNAEGVAEKLRRLFVFYQKVLSKAGFDKYSVLDIQYAGQVVAVHRGASTNVDSAQLQQNIAALLRTDQMLQAHAAAETTEESQRPAALDEAATAPVSEKRAEKAEKVKPETHKPVPAGPPSKGATNGRVKKEPEKKKQEQTKNTRPHQQPKAVMPKRTART